MRSPSTRKRGEVKDTRQHRSIRDHRAVSSMFQPSTVPSTAETRTNSGMSAGISFRTASTISSGSRMRPARSPPYYQLWSARRTLRPGL